MMAVKHREGRSPMISRRSTLTAVLAAAGVTQVAATTTAKAAQNDDSLHRVAMHVDDNDPARMNLALGNAANLVTYYQERGQEVEIEIVAYGPGLHMLRTDTSPIKDRLRSFIQNQPSVAFAACGNTMAGMKRAEGQDPPLVAEAKVVPAGVARLVELQEQGWAYIRP